ncbi:LacI family DNA-binding transcriptional regulator [Rhizobium sp. 32-5/1]|uniref:LacI family DNA-binding transcriptional regulator n=1 Tax=Rhizobium sp. 32-5/1 TaxID=3019602 RepID=UPI00240DB505|nr:LacI family DNA-binding transcriptional regulator [Rhizobium sp. 32-5/1]WEZ82069.1 LacI family DNA-binding transcriptional regulator [Rhizobium sp. 32-5/1]
MDVSDTKLVDVARRAGCSPATVSRVLNDNPNVDIRIRERVLQAAMDLAYVPNGSARSLRSTKSRLAGAVIPTLDHAIYAAMMNSLQSGLSEKGVSLIIGTSAFDIDLEYDQVRLLVERGVDAIVLVGAAHRPETIALLEQRNIAYVFTYTAAATEIGAAVGFDNDKAGRMAARYLLDLGHNRIAMLGGITDNNDRAIARRDGFVAELRENGITPLSIIESAYRVDGGRLGMQQLMGADNPPTAVFCGSDIVAAGALKYCREENIAVPGTVSVLGFDNLEIGELTSPELTTVDVPAKEMGTLAAQYLLATPAQRLHMRVRELPLRLVLRGSTAAASR